MNIFFLFFVIIEGGIYGNRRMIRNPDMSEGQSRCTFRGEVEKFDDEKFLPVPVKKGNDYNQA
jgi:hypothetical protein